MPPVDLNTILPIAEGVALDLIAWWQRREAEGKAPPTDLEVIARAKAKAQAIVSEGQAALDEFPDDSTPG